MPRRVQAAEADGADEVEEERELRELQEDASLAQEGAAARRGGRKKVEDVDAAAVAIQRTLRGKRGRARARARRLKGWRSFTARLFTPKSPEHRSQEGDRRACESTRAAPRPASCGVAPRPQYK